MGRTFNQLRWLVAAHVALFLLGPSSLATAGVFMTEHVQPYPVEWPTLSCNNQPALVADVIYQ